MTHTPTSTAKTHVCAQPQSPTPTVNPPTRRWIQAKGGNHNHSASPLLDLDPN